jgi:oxygen-independent coproporphyrinogen-3 oxidase
MAGIYIHIPFCRQKCHYCNFFSTATVRWKDAFIKALLKEIELRKDYLGGETVRTIYFGGGTPSLLSTGDLVLIFEHLTKFFRIDPDAEITLEANPDDVDEKIALEWKSLPVNRLSIGVQSFFDEDLNYLHRVHDAAQSFRAIESARAAGFTNLTIDLIYGIPTLTMENWETNLGYFFAAGIPHLSAYALTVEQKTPLNFLIRKGRYAPPDEQESVGQFKLLQEMAAREGFIHYEISNFAREGYYSKHNSHYWLGGNYLGLGPSAHSFNGISRQWNVSSISRYIRQDDFNSSIEEKEVLTEDHRYNEYVMTSLRTVWGCDTAHIRNAFGPEREADFVRLARPYLKNGWLFTRGTGYFLTDEGKLFADRIASDLFSG